MSNHVYTDPALIPAEVIRREYEQATNIKFSARRFNYIDYRKITFGQLGWWLPITRVMPILGIGPQRLRSVFPPRDQIEVGRNFPLNLRWFGLNRRTRKLIKITPPEKIDRYEQLGYIPLSEEPFKRLALILGKSIEVFREDGGTGEHEWRFTVQLAASIERDQAARLVNS